MVAAGPAESSGHCASGQMYVTVSHRPLANHVIDPLLSSGNY